MKRKPRKKLERQTLQRKTRRDQSIVEITIEISLPSTKLAETIYTSLLPETRQPRGFRSTTILSRTGKTLHLKIKAADIVALRAASNSFLRFVAVAMKTINVVAPFYIAEDPESSKTTTGSS